MTPAQNGLYVLLGFKINNLRPNTELTVPHRLSLIQSPKMYLRSPPSC